MKRLKNASYRDKHYNRRRKIPRSPQGVRTDDERYRRAMDALYRRVESR